MTINAELAELAEPLDFCDFCGFCVEPFSGLEGPHYSM
jgi:hypothetical protein